MFYVKVKGVVFCLYNLVNGCQFVVIMSIFIRREDKLKWMNLLQKGVGSLLRWHCIQCLQPIEDISSVFDICCSQQHFPSPFKPQQ